MQRGDMPGTDDHCDCTILVLERLAHGEPHEGFAIQVTLVPPGAEQLVGVANGPQFRDRRLDRRKDFGNWSARFDHGIPPGFTIRIAGDFGEHVEWIAMVRPVFAFGLVLFDHFLLGSKRAGRRPVDEPNGTPPSERPKHCLPLGRIFGERRKEGIGRFVRLVVEQGERRLHSRQRGIVGQLAGLWRALDQYHRRIKRVERRDQARG